MSLFLLFCRGQKARATADTPIYDPSSGNPFAERPSTARQNELAKSSLELALADLDKYSNAPEGCDENVWERMCQYRRQKIESEQLVICNFIPYAMTLYLKFIFTRYEREGVKTSFQTNFAIIQVKQKALVLAAMQAFLQKRQEEDEELKQEIEDLLTALNK